MVTRPASAGTVREAEYVSGSTAEYQSRYRASHREQQRAHERAYYARHREEILARRRAHYAAHPEERAAYRTRYNAEHRGRYQQRQQRHLRWMKDIKQAQGCTDCGTHEGLLDHHHIDPSTRSYSLTGMANHSLESILDEIAKCTVLCRSCHRKRHAAMRAAA
mgnify:CR=1 FL=1